MSLLEDVFLEDEAGEAQELERIIEGDDIEEERARSPDSNEDSEKEDEAEEDKRRVDPSKTNKVRVVKNPRFILNPARLTGPRGIQIIPEHFKDFKFTGKGHEKEDLDMVLKKLEHWAYRLYPRFQFADCLKKIETLGKKRPVMVHLHKIRSDQFLSEETVEQKDSSDDEAVVQQTEDDEFDKLLQQQIDIARNTPMGKHVATPKPDGRSPMSFHMPKATSSPSISEEQRERILRNKKLAEEKRLARLKNNPMVNGNTVDLIAHPAIKETGGKIDLTNIDSKLSKQNEEKSSNDAIDITDEASVGSEMPKQNRSHFVDNAVITTNYSVIEKRNKMQADSSGDDEITNDETSVSVEVHNISGNRYKKKNVIESSDDESAPSNHIPETDVMDVNDQKEGGDIDQLSDNYESDKENVTTNINLVANENLETLSVKANKKPLSNEGIQIINQVNSPQKQVSDKILSSRVDIENSLNIVRETENNTNMFEETQTQDTVEGDVESIAEAIDILKENTNDVVNTNELDSEINFEVSAAKNIESELCNFEKKPIENVDFDSMKNCENDVSDEIMDVDFTEDF